MKNKGITIASLMMYVIGLTIFLSLLTATNTVFSTTFFSRQSNTIIAKEINKFNMYFSELSKENDGASIIGGNLVFSDGNIIRFDGENILKNDKKILGNMQNMIYNVVNINGQKVLKMQVTFLKYNISETKEFEYVLGRGY